MRSKIADKIMAKSNPDEEKELTKDETFMARLSQEIGTWEYLAEGLTQPHQQSVKLEILAKVRDMKEILTETKATNQ